ncbi:MAG TPA: hypothetical protein VI895_13985 [Bdellovibrionota bacterium]|nr:hypothetical protein [Bdellovibrionota bacterium]
MKEYLFSVLIKYESQIVTTTLTAATAIIAVFVGAIANHVATQMREEKRRRATLKGIINTMAFEFVLAFERLVMVYEQIFGVPGRIGLTKTTLYDFSGFSLIRDAVHLSADGGLLADMTFLEERYFHVKRQLDEGAKEASRVEALRRGQQTEAVMTEMLAQQLIQNGIAFASNAPDCFKKGEPDRMFDKIASCTNHVLEAAERNGSTQDLKELRKIFDDAQVKKRNVDATFASKAKKD